MPGIMHTCIDELRQMIYKVNNPRGRGRGREGEGEGERKRERERERGRENTGTITTTGLHVCRRIKIIIHTQSHTHT